MNEADKTRVPSNLRPTTRECVHLFMRGHFRSRVRWRSHYSICSGGSKGARGPAPQNTIERFSTYAFLRVFKAFLESIYYFFQQNCNQTITFVNLCCFCQFDNLFAAHSYYLFQATCVYNYNFSYLGPFVHTC